MARGGYDSPGCDQRSQNAGGCCGSCCMLDFWLFFPFLCPFLYSISTASEYVHQAPYGHIYQQCIAWDQVLWRMTRVFDSLQLSSWIISMGTGVHTDKKKKDFILP